MPTDYVPLLTVAAVALIYGALSYFEKRALQRQLEEAMKLLASPGYAAFASGKASEARARAIADAPNREPTPAEIEAAIEKELYDRAENEPHSAV